MFHIVFGALALANKLPFITLDAGYLGKLDYLQLSVTGACLISNIEYWQIAFVIGPSLLPLEYIRAKMHLENGVQTIQPNSHVARVFSLLFILSFYRYR